MNIIKCNELIINYDKNKNDFRFKSTNLSKLVDHRHRTILENIEKHKIYLEKISRLPFETETFETKGGQQTRKIYLLTEDQCYFILTLMRNNEKVIEAKYNLIMAFRQARNYNTEKDIARMEGKKVRKLETDAIQKMIMYAKSQGSKNADRYYTNFTKMTNDILGIEAGDRELLSKDILSKIGMIETIIMLSISDGIARNMDYKDIYKLAKFRVSEIVDISKKYIN